MPLKNSAGSVTFNLGDYATNSSIAATYATNSNMNTTLTNYVTNNVLANTITNFTDIGTLQTFTNRVYISGLYVSYVNVTTISISKGEAMDINKGVKLFLNNTLTKNLGNPFSLGDAGNMLTTAAIANTWYAVYIFMDAGNNIDVFATPVQYNTGVNVPYPSATALNSVLCQSNFYRFIGYFYIGTNTLVITRFQTDIVSNEIIANRWYTSMSSWSYGSPSPSVLTLKTLLAPPNSICEGMFNSRSDATTGMYCIMCIFIYDQDHTNNSYPIFQVNGSGSVSKIDKFSGFRFNSSSQIYIQRVSGSDFTGGFCA